MSSVAIYMEGGGNGRDSKAALRLGMETFLSPLKDAVRAKAWKWRLVCCGGRNATFDGFRNAVQNGDDSIVALLVDAEGAVNGPATAHLQSGDRWDLNSHADDVVHLMVQAMEAWIVADSDALAAYYGKKFQKSPLPKAQNLETIAKNDVAKALEEATRDTQKGSYHKIRHASDLLKRIDRKKVQKRCPQLRPPVRNAPQADPEGLSAFTDRAPSRPPDAASTSAQIGDVTGYRRVGCSGSSVCMIDLPL